MRNTYFTPGPAAMYPTVEKHYQEAFNLQLGSISHRSAQFRSIYQHTVEQLRLLLNIPEANGVFFTGSATEIWERIIQNTVEQESFHLVNGSFSQKFYDFSGQLGHFAHKLEKPFGQSFDYQEINIPKYTELICTTANETSSGAAMLPADIHKLKRSHKNKLLAVDMVSAAPYPEFDFSLVDTALFSVQKCFGMPAGLGLWIANQACLDKALHISKKDISIGTYHSLPSLWKNFEKFETPETPNVLAIYVLGKVAEDMNRIGIKNIRKETDKKAKLIYNFLASSPHFSAFVQNPNHQSQTVIVANLLSHAAANVIAAVKEKNMVLGAGYGNFKNTQIRIANFPAVNVAEVEQLVELLKDI
jgi:phosphoserine aminotransferase